MSVLNILSFVGFTALVAILSYYWTKGTDEHHSEGYFLGGRSLTAPVIAGSLLLTNLSTEQMVGLNGQAYSEGVLVMAWETLAAIAIVVTALMLVPRYLRTGISTIPSFLEERYDEQTKIITSILFLSGYVIVLMPIVLYSGALALSIGIAIQNFPEGAIISMPLQSHGLSKGKAFLYGAMSGIVEPIAAVITIFLTGIAVPLLPYLLSFAAGAMIYVVVEELIPESQAGEHSNIGTIGVAAGFVLMMILDVALG